MSEGRKRWSYWERCAFEGPWDVVVIGAGLTGCSTAFHLRKAWPDARIAVVDRHHPGEGASSKNAGFVCFGSPTELFDDARERSVGEVVGLVRDRVRGARALRRILGDAAIEYRASGGLEFFPADGVGEIFTPFDAVADELEVWNDQLRNVLPEPAFRKVEPPPALGPGQAIELPNEGVLNPMSALFAWYDRLRSSDVRLITGQSVASIGDLGGQLSVEVTSGTVSAERVAVCTNGVGGDLLRSIDAPIVRPARNQVAVYRSDRPHGLEHAIHAGAGYYYVRPLDLHHVLFGGARHLDPRGETTVTFGESALILDEIDRCIRSWLPGPRWTRVHTHQGVLGLREGKRPVVGHVGDGTYAAVGFGGMGVALSTEAGRALAERIVQDAAG